MNLTHASLVLPSGLSGPEKKAAQMLVGEAEKRSFVRWPITADLPAANTPRVVLGQRAALLRSFPSLAEQLSASDRLAPEGYEIISLPPATVIVAGNDARGVLFGAGRLLRLLDYGRGALSLPAGIKIATAPRYRLRGHQVGYRPKTNSYDGWDVAQWEQYVRDLVIFGANAIEGIPPLSDDAADSPHFPLPPMKMMIEQSRIAQEYGIAYWVWYPALNRGRKPLNYDDPAEVTAALKDWDVVLSQLPQVDALFVPGGDPGHNPPKPFFRMIAQQVAQLRRHHPKAEGWISAQTFSGEGIAEFFELLKPEPAWLTGLVWSASGTSIPIEEFRARVPRRYPVRNYNDITHSVLCGYPVPEWDFAFATTQHREVINPRPVDQAIIFRNVQPHADHGMITYSEGCNDDVNKSIWSALAWDPEASVTDIVRDYGRYFISTRLGEAFAQGLLALERNWRGPLLTNGGVYTTLGQFQEMERTAPPPVLANWRFQQALYRAYYDAFLRARLLAETVQENQAMACLRRARVIGTLAAMAAARAELAPPPVGAGAALRARVFELAEALFQSIRMQLSVPRYKATAVQRGANLDLIDEPLSNAPWLLLRFDEIAELPDEAARLAAVDVILNWTNPGPGGFYDHLGDATAMPHLVRRVAYADDPSFTRSPRFGFVVPKSFSGGGTLPIQSRRSAWRYSEMAAYSPKEGPTPPLEMLYRDLDPTARYRVRVIYATENPGSVALTANETFVIHPLMLKTVQTMPLEFEIPPAATAGGELRLAWTSSGGRSLQVAEVWLVRSP
ncbi:MAG: hypothetical protein EXS37_11875 [Opitutus sp.]|nr:hypothetical protein [Opitutus sp.]